LSAWTPLLVGVLAFLGAFLGQFVAFDLNAAAKRREVRREQIERFAEFLSEDNTWMEHFRDETLFGEVDHNKKDIAPKDKAFAIYALYFRKELSSAMIAFVTARREYQAALNGGQINRLLASSASGQPMSITKLPDAEVELIQAKYSPYYQALLGNLSVAAEIVQETIPEESQMARWCADSWAGLMERLKKFRAP
jgi:hypothetical protein